ncbi:Uncharacterised protein [Mycobacteroides abscessus]|nr:Uncharacterised protein [Mycobacteroides abscessus]
MSRSSNMSTHSSPTSFARASFTALRGTRTGRSSDRAASTLPELCMNR